jgi:sec-independent protein translocase protein TatB
MFDISWSEFLLIGVVALVVIGPKELPAVMRTLGQWTRKVRGMASEFQNQFQEAMREAEMADLKKQVDDMAQGVKQSVTQIDSLKDVRDDFRGVGDDLKRSLAAGPEPAAALPTADPEPALTQTSAEPPTAPLEVTSTSAADTPAAGAAPPEAPGEQPARELETAAAQLEATSTDPADKPVETDATGRTG